MDESVATFYFTLVLVIFLSFRANFSTCNARLYDAAICCHPTRITPSDRFSGFYGVYRTAVSRSDLEHKHAPCLKSGPY